MPKQTIDYPTMKAIRVSEDMAANWDPDLVRLVLDGELEFLYDLMGEKMEFTAEPTDREIQRIAQIKEVLGK